MRDVERFDDLLLLGVRGRCQLGNRRGAAERRAERLDEAVQLQAELLQRRGTWTDQPLSRKCRLSSPRIVGIA